MFLLKRHMSFYLAVACGFLGWLGALMAGMNAPLTLGVNIFFLTYVILSISALSRLSPARMARNAATADAPILAIFGVTLGAVAMTMIALFGLLNETPKPDPVTLSVRLASVPLAWGTIHLMAALHYAHAWWHPDTPTEPRKGLSFPHSPSPSGWDFIYFAVTIGLCAQTSDVEVTSTAMRKRVTAQGVVAFFFNTVLIAMAVNLALTLAG